MRARAASLFIATFLASQLLLPLRYYLGDDERDERFAWRMFSPIRVSQCRAEWTEGGVPRSPELHVAVSWTSLMSRARRPVLVAYARRRCAALRGEVARPDVRLRLTCDHPDGRPRRLATPIVNLCETLR